MGRKQLVRETKRAALLRMEDAARSDDDFKLVVSQWNHIDRNRKRRDQYHEIGRPNAEMLHWDKSDASDKKGKLKEGLDTVIPRPFDHPWWRQLMRGDFIDTIYDNAYEMWQLIGNREIASLVKGLSDKQKEALFSRVVRLCSAAQVAYCYDKTDRAVRKLLVATLDSMRDKLDLKEYNKKKAILDNGNDE